MRTLVGSIALAAVAHAEAMSRYKFGMDLDFDAAFGGPLGPSYREPSQYRAPETDHAFHMSKAEEKRARKAARLNELSKRGAFA